MNAAQKIRLKQIRFSARVVNRLSTSRIGRLGIGLLRTNRLTGALLDRLLGYHRAFASIADAERSIAPYAIEGHESPGNVLWHLNAVEKPLPSDYPAMSHMQTHRHRIQSVFDWGGSAGNVFYRYDRYFGLPPTLRWTICDLARNIEVAAARARERGEDRLRFTTGFGEMEGCDLLLASGSLHYFEDPVGVVSSLSRKPRFLLINRTPLTDREPYAVVQDGGDWMVACRVHNRARLYRGFEALGYELRDEWTAPEFRIQVAGSPALAVPCYSGFFMALRDPV